jgi:hypothetical protein
MKAYKFQIWKEINNGGKFSHNAERVETIHANNFVSAKKKITLGQEEWIYKTTCLGSVRKIVETRFEYTPLKGNSYEALS